MLRRDPVRDFASLKIRGLKTLIFGVAILSHLSHNLSVIPRLGVTHFSLDHV